MATTLLMCVPTTTHKATGCRLGDAEEVNNFASESKAVEYGIEIIKEQTKYWDWSLSEDCTEENTKSAVRCFLGISSQTKPKLFLN